MYVAGQCNNEEASVINCELLPPCEIYDEIRRILRQRFDIFFMVVNGLCEVTNNYCHQMRKDNCIISFFDYLLKREKNLQFVTMRYKSNRQQYCYYCCTRAAY